MEETAAKATANVGSSKTLESGSRESSKIEFPYSDLESAIEVAKAIQHVGGSGCTWDQLAAKMNQAANGGGFRTRIASAKTFGLLTYGGGSVMLTKLGGQICDPEQEAPAKAEAFLCVPLYRAIHEQFKGLTLPPAPGLEAAMVTLGVAPKQKERARQVFTKSATLAGFFAYGPNRLVAPAFKNGRKAEDSACPSETESEQKRASGTGSSDSSKRHPFIEGLLETLPPAALNTPKIEWSLKDRQDWLQTAAGIFNLIYKSGSDEKGAVNVSIISTNSAN
jgi:hypothetical protein